MLALLTKTALAAGLLLLSSASPAAAELRQGPTGIEYVKRFVASAAVVPGGPCTFQCPASADGTVQPTTLTGVMGGITEGTTFTTCSYPGMKTCEYNDDTGASTVVIGTDSAFCASRAVGPICPAPLPPAKRRRRAETKLERVVRERQWKPRRNERP